MMSLREQFLWMSFVHGEITLFMEVPRYDSVGGLFVSLVVSKLEFFEYIFVGCFCQVHQIEIFQHLFVRNELTVLLAKALNKSCF